jgi:hydroxymethylpyrimidine pyrophosphatase-like HAD family hydrolase/fructoselysine-6-P-deglycase FrlB-like protein
MRARIDDFARSVARCAHLDALFVGSGGSLTSAHFATFLHGRFAGRAAQTVTPYELASLERTLDDAAILICSAGGSNPDVIAGAQVAIKRMPPGLVAITTRSGSPLEREFEKAVWPVCHAFATPTQKDGFLATNSLLATMVLLSRAYEQFAGARASLPGTLAELLHPDSTRGGLMDRLREEAGPLAARPTLVVLYDATTKPAAMDVESRFTEAALASIQPADYRNFAHGRHHWLARHAASTGVLAFAAEGDEVARRTLSLLPAAIPRWQSSVELGVRGALTAVCQSILLALVAGESKGLDPGRPHVPTFGRKLYHLRAMPRLFPAATSNAERMNLAIERKARVPLATLAARGELDPWLKHYRAFTDRLADARVRAIALDYDGTLCGPERRLAGPSPAIVQRLNAILDAGYSVAVATGRGKSVREVLRKHIRSAARRARVFVAYHNGAEVALLEDADCPPPQQPLATDLVAIAAALRESPSITRHATVEAKGHQIAIKLTAAGNAGAVFQEATRIVRTHATCGKIAVVTSSHSVDVIAAGVCKLNVVSRLVKELGLTDRGASSILCIGDRGRAPGNDADLLSHPLSLSVDQASDDPATCWTLAAPGLRYDQACLEYLTRLRPTRAGLRFDTKGVLS